MVSKNLSGIKDLTGLALPILGLPNFNMIDALRSSAASYIFYLILYVFFNLVDSYNYFNNVELRFTNPSRITTILN